MRVLCFFLSAFILVSVVDVEAKLAQVRHAKQAREAAHTLLEKSGSERTARLMAEDDARKVAKKISHVSHDHQCGATCTKSFKTYDQCIEKGTLSLSCVGNALDEMEEVLADGGIAAHDATKFQQVFGRQDDVEQATMVLETAIIYEELSVAEEAEEEDAEEEHFDDGDFDVEGDHGHAHDVEKKKLKAEKKKIEKEEAEIESEKVSFFQNAKKKMKKAGQYLGLVSPEDAEAAAEEEEDALLDRALDLDGKITGGVLRSEKNRATRGFFANLLSSAEQVISENTSGPLSDILHSVAQSSECLPVACKEFLSSAIMCALSEDEKSLDDRSYSNSGGNEHTVAGLVASRHEKCAQAALDKILEYKELKAKKTRTKQELRQYNLLIGDILIEDLVTISKKDPRLTGAVINLLAFVAGDKKNYYAPTLARDEALVRKYFKTKKLKTTGVLDYDFSHDTAPDYVKAKTPIRDAINWMHKKLMEDKASLEQLPDTISRLERSLAASKTAAKEKELMEAKEELAALERLETRLHASYQGLLAAYKNVRDDGGSNIEKTLKTLKKKAEEQRPHLTSKSVKTRQTANEAVGTYEGWLLAYDIAVGVSGAKEKLWTDTHAKAKGTSASAPASQFSAVEAARAKYEASKRSFDQKPGKTRGQAMNKAKAELDAAIAAEAKAKGGVAKGTSASAPASQFSAVEAARAKYEASKRSFDQKPGKTRGQAMNKAKAELDAAIAAEAKAKAAVAAAERRARGQRRAAAKA